MQFLKKNNYFTAVFTHTLCCFTLILQQVIRIFKQGEKNMCYRLLIPTRFPKTRSAQKKQRQQPLYTF